MKARLLLALHFHQPVGNFDSVFRDAVRLCYAPLIEHYERHPGVRAAFHFSGCLLEWLEVHDRPFLDRVLGLAAAGRFEPLGGGFYEPILPVIPRADALDQIARLAGWWEKRCGRRPKGVWIAERVWEPSLAELLAEAGAAYTILDDQHLRFAGLLDERFRGAFTTERAGRGIAFYPSDFQLRYLIPFRPLDAVRRHFETLPDDGREWVLTYGDDAEKFGLWPGTHPWVYGEGWLERFFALLEEDKGPVRSDSPGAHLAENPPARRVHVPSASYTEMLEWALPAESVKAYGRVRAAALGAVPAEHVRAFVRGPLWDMFLARYPEADQLHKHVLWTSRRSRALPPGSPAREEAITSVLRAQCNCAYWHGLFGGIYFPHLRHGAYESVLAADAALARSETPGVTVEVEDIDADREPEIILRSPVAQAFFRPSDGGTLAELDYLPARFNVTNVVSRWRESYHERSDQTHAPAPAGALSSPHEKGAGIRDADLEGRHFDRLPLRSLRDFWSARPPDPARLTSLAGLELAQGRLQGWERTAGGFTSRARLGPLLCARSVEMDASGAMRIRWEPAADGARGEAAAGGAAEARGWFGTLLCLSLLTGRAPDRALSVTDNEEREIRGAPGDPLEVWDAIRFSLEDRAFGFAVDLIPAQPALMLATPIETLQRSEDKVEAAYQGTLFALCWQLARPESGPRPIELQLRFRKLG